jgi:predicted dehydrogenase
MQSAMAATVTALVGTGFIGPVHLEALRRLGRPVIGVLGSSAEKSLHAAKTLGLPKGYADFPQLLADPDVTVVHLASPNRHHFDQCSQAIAAGKHVICEKPLAMTAAQTAQLAALAEAAPVVTAVCYNVRFYPLCLEVRARIAAGQLGNVYHVTGSYVQDWLLHDTDFNWRVLAGEGGALRAVADIGTHWLDLVTSITGLNVVRLCADLRTFVPVRWKPAGSVETFQGKTQTPLAAAPVPIDTEDFGNVLLEFDTGARGSFHVSQVSAGRKNCLRFEIAGEKAALAWNSERPNELWHGLRDRPNELLVRDPALLQDAVRPFANYPGGHNEGFPDTFKQLFRSIYDYIDRGDFTAPRPFPTFADGHREVILCEAILHSHRDKRWVDVPQ